MRLVALKQMLTDTEFTHSQVSEPLLLSQFQVDRHLNLWLWLGVEQAETSVGVVVEVAGFLTAQILT